MSSIFSRESWDRYRNFTSNHTVPSFAGYMDFYYYEDNKIKQESACDMTNLDEMDNEEDKCNCGFELEKGKEGCGKVIDEIVDRDGNGEITNTRWIHCGEDKELCNECREKKKDALGGDREK